MKAGLHPEYQLCTVSCACGNTFETRGTKSEIKVEICSACHPFFTGTQKFVDSAGRVDKFRKRFGEKQEAVKTSSKKKQRKEAARAKAAEVTQKQAMKKKVAKKKVVKKKVAAKKKED